METRGGQLAMDAFAWSFGWVCIGKGGRGGDCCGWMEGLRKRKGEMTYCIPSRINDALYAPANGLEGIRADARGSLRDALDSLAGFGG